MLQRDLTQVGIAKGVRRIVGVTRALAHGAVQRAQAFDKQLDAADQIEDLALDATVSFKATACGALCV